MIQNIVIGKPLIHPKALLSNSDKDWIDNEMNNTLFTENRFLPSIMKEAGIVNSISEVKRNRPDLVITLDKVDFLRVKWGKKILHIVVGK